MYVAGGYLATKRLGLLAWVVAVERGVRDPLQALYNLGYWVT